MHAIADYHLISSTDHVHLAQAVRDHLHQGWQPLGGPVATQDANTGRMVLIQAVVKYAGPVGPGGFHCGRCGARLADESQPCPSCGAA